MVKNYQNQYKGLPEQLRGRILELSPLLQDFFRPIKEEHRLEPVGTLSGVDFINDSKATNINSVWFALEVMTKPVILILGGVDRGNDYSQLDEVVLEKVKLIVTLGDPKYKIYKHFKKLGIPLVGSTSLEECVATCYINAKPGYVVLLSPACASFDWFENYEDRGAQFKNIIKRI